MSFNTSLNNYARAYLTSDSPLAKSVMNANYIQFGGSGDSIIFCSQKGNTITSLFSFPGIRTNKSVNSIRIKVIRDGSGYWNLFADSSGGQHFIQAGIIPGNEILPVSYFGIFCRYTASNATKFYFDDFYVGDIIRDTVPPGIQNVSFSDSITLKIKFTEPMDTGNLNSGEIFSLKNNPEKLQKPQICKDDPSIIFIPINAEEKLFFCDSLEVSDLHDISGNLLKDTSVFFCYYIPGNCEEGDLVINEILFDPDEEGSKFVELYNRLAKLIDPGSLGIAARTPGGPMGPIIAASDQELFIPPYAYFVLTADSMKLCTRYYVPCPAMLSEMKMFPSLDRDSGEVFLFRLSDTILIDKITYNKSMNFPYLQKTKGVSLERLSADIPSGYSSNWQSASETTGYATPTYVNSHHYLMSSDDLDVVLDNSIISPDNDGKNDLLLITVNSTNPGIMLSLRIYDIRGRLIRTITDRVFTGDHSVFVWDGTDDGGKVVPIGYYLILTDGIDAGGIRSKIKKTIVVAHSLN